ncbi:unnamed protein product [marine sediment metagenome]|uniref:Peptidase M16 N-terminal domain-containing protein n=1 Tax=marine sediment metagenome TaxID=412755 RepID=X0ZEY5_9ZZZZ
MLLKGTKTKTRQEIAQKIESLGGTINTYGGNNSFGCSVSVLKEDFDTGLEILADVIMNSTFLYALMILAWVRSPRGWTGKRLDVWLINIFPGIILP